MDLELRDYQKECLNIIDNLEPGAYFRRLWSKRELYNGTNNDSLNILAIT